MMADTIFFITDHSVQVDVLHTAEDILLNVRILRSSRIRSLISARLEPFSVPPQEAQLSVKRQAH